MKKLTTIALVTALIMCIVAPTATSQNFKPIKIMAIPDFDPTILSDTTNHEATIVFRFFRGDLGDLDEYLARSSYVDSIRNCPPFELYLNKENYSDCDDFSEDKLRGKGLRILSSAELFVAIFFLANQGILKFESPNFMHFDPYLILPDGSTKITERFYPPCSAWFHNPNGQVFRFCRQN